MSSDGKRVIPLAKLQKLLQRIRKRKTVVLTNGVFDLLHVGHVTYLERAKSLGDLLVVAVNGDASVRALKGPSRPVHWAPARARVLAGLRPVDFVTVFPDVRASKVIRAVKPDVYVKGGDYTEETLDPQEWAALKSVGAKIRIIPFVKGFSTTKTIHRMKKK